MTASTIRLRTRRKALARVIKAAKNNQCAKHRGSVPLKENDADLPVLQSAKAPATWTIGMSTPPKTPYTANLSAETTRTTIAIGRKAKRPKAIAVGLLGSTPEYPRITQKKIIAQLAI